MTKYKDAHGNTWVVIDVFGYKQATSKGTCIGLDKIEFERFKKNNGLIEQ
jgi:hypothetical protein